MRLADCAALPRAVALLAGMLLGSAAGCGYAEVAGRVLLAAGDAIAVRDGRPIRLVVGTPIEGRDLLRTGKESHLQVRMTDESLIALKPDSALSLERYRYAGSADGSENAWMRLLKGGFRTVTGFIGRTNRSAYRVTAGPATIGIRGTAFTLALCDGGSCMEASGRSAPDGLYGNVTEGQVTATNRVGEFAFSAGQTFFAGAVDEGIRALPTPPPFVADRLEGQRRSTQRAAASDPGTPREGSSREGAAREGNARRPALSPDRVEAIRKPGDITVPSPEDTGKRPMAASLQDDARQLLRPPIRLLEPPPVVVTEIFDSSGKSTVFPPVTGFSVAYPYPGGPFELATGGPNLGGFDAGNRLLQFTLPSIDGALAQGGFAEQGGIASGPTLIRWGRWDNAVVRAPDNVVRAGVSMLYFTFNDVTPNIAPPALPTAGTVTYVGSVGPNPLGFHPAIPPIAINGLVTGSKLMMDFTNRQATLEMSFQFDLTNSNPTVQKAFSVIGSASPVTSEGRLLAGNLVEACGANPCGNPGYQGSFRLGLAGAGGYGLAAATGGIADTRSAFSATFVRVFQAPVTSSGAVAAPVGAQAVP